jgi:hypothetical protein
MNGTPRILADDDHCRRAAYYFERWQVPALTPSEALYSAVEAGLTDSTGKDPGDAASDALMEIATSRGIDSNQEDLLGQAEHLAGIASFVVYLLRTGGPWKRSEPIKVGNHVWSPSAFLDPSESHLRRVVLCSTWNIYRQLEAEHDWRTLESAIYGVPMDLVVVVLGQERNGRRHGPLVKGWTHPVSKQLRFRKRDGTGFDGAWEPVFQHESRFTREQWLDQLVEDGLLPEVVLIHHVDVPENFNAILHLAESKLSRIAGTTEPPEPQFSQCFQRTNPCPFRSCCPRGLEPSAELGFAPTTSSRASLA